MAVFLLFYLLTSLNSGLKDWLKLRIVGGNALESQEVTKESVPCKNSEKSFEPRSAKFLGKCSGKAGGYSGSGPGGVTLLLSEL